MVCILENQMGCSALLEKLGTPCMSFKASPLFQTWMSLTSQRGLEIVSSDFSGLLLSDLLSSPAVTSAQGYCGPSQQVRGGLPNT